METYIIIAVIILSVVIYCLSVLIAFAAGFILNHWVSKSVYAENASLRELTAKRYGYTPALKKTPQSEPEQPKEHRKPRMPTQNTEGIHQIKAPDYFQAKLDAVRKDTEKARG